jgi:hypothetical protein
VTELQKDNRAIYRFFLGSRALSRFFDLLRQLGMLHRKVLLSREMRKEDFDELSEDLGRSCIIKRYWRENNGQIFDKML